MRPFLLLPSLLLAATATAASVPRDSRLGVVPNGVFDSHPDEPVQDHYVVQYLAGLDAMTRQEHIASVNALIAELGGGIFAGVLKSFDFGAFQGYYVNAPKIALVQLVDTGLVRDVADFSST